MSSSANGLRGTWPKAPALSAGREGDRLDDWDCAPVDRRDLEEPLTDGLLCSRVERRDVSKESDVLNFAVGTYRDFEDHASGRACRKFRLNAAKHLWIRDRAPDANGRLRRRRRGCGWGRRKQTSLGGFYGRFMSARRFDSRAALGLTLGGIPGVLVAGLLVRSLPLSVLRWVVVFVVIYAATTMLRSAFAERRSESLLPAAADRL
jgi:hypothetical protein